MGEIMRGEATEAQIGGFLVALRMKGETAEEIVGCAEAMREHVIPVTPTRADVVDVVGTGGDGAGTINISTAAGLVVAAAGAGVAKHGNRAASSACGAADVLEAIGFQLEQTPERIASSIDELGFGFMFARVHHPSMRHAAPVRQALGTRTVFNILGPLSNPAGAKDGLFGVYSAELARTYAETLAGLGTRRAFVVHGDGGLDELSPTGPNLVLEVRDGDIREWELDPRTLGFYPGDPAALRGGSPAENASALLALLAGENGVRRDAVVLNAAAALVAAGAADDLGDGLGLAAEAIDTGSAGERLVQLREFSHG
jgi:anthranilate phosphoribosyltransferase